MSYRLSEIYIFPVKSLRGFKVEEAEVEPQGLRSDRRWMIVDPLGRFITQRQAPQMTLVQTKMEAGSLKLSSGSNLITVAPTATTPTHVEVWGDHVDAFDQGDTAAAWLSKNLGFQARLVWMPEAPTRVIGEKAGWPDHPVSFADRFPLLLISTGSMEDLNRRLPDPLSIERFRPNLVVECDEPFAEDRWKEIRVGDVRFGVVKPCERCAIPTVDPDTGERGDEPLRTLAEFRKKDGKILFGQNLVPLETGWIHTGDIVSISSEIDNRRAKINSVA